MDISIEGPPIGMALEVSAVHLEEQGQLAIAEQKTEVLLWQEIGEVLHLDLAEIDRLGEGQHPPESRTLQLPASPFLSYS